MKKERLKEKEMVIFWSLELKEKGEGKGVRVFCVLERGGRGLAGLGDGRR